VLSLCSQNSILSDIFGVLMHQMSYPRVLVINGEPFNSLSATGITISNLFRGWPKDRIAQIYTASIEPQKDICERNLRLNNNNLLFINRIRRSKNRTSSTRAEPPNPIVSVNRQVQPPSGKGRDLLRSIVTPLIDLIPYDVSRELIAWIEEFKPQVIYSLLGNIRFVRLVQAVADHFSIPVVPHFMDDWISTYSPPSSSKFATSINKSIIVKVTNNLMKRVRVGFCIGDAMADEYSEKFDCEFKVFMNPVQFDKQLAFLPNESKSIIQFVYIGGLHLSRYKNLLEIGKAMLELRGNGLKVELLVYAPRHDVLKYSEKLQKVKIRVCGTISPDDVGAVLQESHVAVHVESFNTEDTRYTRLSVSTKIPQYFASGLPVLVYGPGGIASCRYVHDSEAGIVVAEQNLELLKSAIFSLSSDALLRRALGAQGRKVAEDRHDMVKVREDFCAALNAAANVVIQ
jgi:glycosyltransferase involved in cell wall biosynthesis